ncbi:MAG: hypothetical protein GW763_00930 [Paraglaciecola sp.]|nr:hypothetical protein [Paraglaciecola sp.]NCT46557.1 hypothetical protein [Paraglaciecola sp.]
MFNCQFVLHRGAILFISLFMLGGCLQHHERYYFAENFASAEPSIAASDNTIKLVNSAFYQAFIGGAWRYKGAVRSNGRINAYIQIPDPLNMTEAAQQDYLKQAICPSSNHHKMWQEIKGTTLAVHVYTNTRSHTTFAYCDNPAAESV